MDAAGATRLPEDQPLRVHTAAKGLHALVDVTADELLEHAKISKVSASTPDAATIVANCEMKTPMDTYAAKVTVTLHTPADLTLRQRIAARASDAIRSIARGKTKTLLSTATDVRDAVKAEVKALRASTDWSRDAIWLLLSDSAGGQVLVFIPLSEVQWQG